MAEGGFRTRREAVDQALRLLARRLEQTKARELLGIGGWVGDLHRERLDDDDEAARAA